LGFGKAKTLKAVENPLSGWVRRQKENYSKGLGGVWSDDFELVRPLIYGRSALITLFTITPGSSHPGLITFDTFRVGCVELLVVAGLGVWKSVNPQSG